MSTSPNKFAVDLEGRTLGDWDAANVAAVPSNLRERFAAIQQKYADGRMSPEERIAAADAARKENLENIRSNARASGTEKLNAARERRVKQMQALVQSNRTNNQILGDVNISPAKKVPAKIKKKLSTSPTSKPLSISVIESKLERAERNRGKALSAKQAAARKSSSRVNEVKQRKMDMSKTDTFPSGCFEMQFNKTDSGEDASKINGWQSRVVLPPHLSSRLTTLLSRFSYDAEERVRQADANRAAFNAAKVAKARNFNARSEKAAARRKLVQGNKDFFTVTVDNEDAVAAASGWGSQEAFPLPARLQERLKETASKFSVDVSARSAAADEKRAEYIRQIKSKAAEANDKIAEAQSRRMLSVGDDMHYTVSVDEDRGMVQQSKGWGKHAKAFLPSSLLGKLSQAKPASLASLKSKISQADARREAFYAAKASKASISRDKAAAAASRRAISSGNDNFFTVSVEDDSVASVHGWGKQTGSILTKKLKQRDAELKGKFSYDAASRFHGAQVRHAIAVNDTASKAARFNEHARDVSTRAMLQKGNKNTFQVTFNNESEFSDAPEAASGWGQQIKPRLPKSLEARLQKLKAEHQRAPLAERQAAAEIQRTNFRESIRNKAAKFNDLAATVGKRGALQKGDGNTFMVSFDKEENSTAAQAQGWGSQQPVALPPHLMQRAEQLSNAFARHTSLEERQANANKKRQEFLSSIADKAIADVERVSKVRARKGIAAGNDNIFTIGLENESDNVSSSNGWGAQGRSKLPARLMKRLETLQGKFAYDPVERQNRAEFNRASFVADVAAKARETSLKVTMAAQARKLAQGNDNFFTVDATGDSPKDTQGWGNQVSPKLPKKLARRYEDLKGKFSYNAQERFERATEKREAFVAARAASAANHGMQVAEVQARKALSVGNENIVTFTFDKEGHSSTQQGWGQQVSPVELPARLTNRLGKLQKKFSKSKNFEERQAQADANREKFHRAVAMKATESSDKAFAARSRKALEAGSDFVFTVTSGDDKADSAPGWGTQTAGPMLTKRLAERAATLTEKFSSKDSYEVRQARAKRNRSQETNKVRSRAQKTLLNVEKARSVKHAIDTSSNMVLMNVPQQRVLSPVKLPKKLENRLETLQKRFAYDPVERERQVELNRRIRLNEIREKGKKFAARPKRSPEQALRAAEAHEEEQDDSICATAKESCTIC